MARFTKVYVECFLIAFQIESDEDTWWKADIRETKEEVVARGLKFLNWCIPYLLSIAYITPLNL